jgi:hypothetical protein
MPVTLPCKSDQRSISALFQPYRRDAATLAIGLVETSRNLVIHIDV